MKGKGGKGGGVVRGGLEDSVFFFRGIRDIKENLNVLIYACKSFREC